jgi:hypothetical protein
MSSSTESSPRNPVVRFYRNFEDFSKGDIAGSINSLSIFSSQDMVQIKKIIISKDKPENTTSCGTRVCGLVFFLNSVQIQCTPFSETLHCKLNAIYVNTG